MSVKKPKRGSDGRAPKGGIARAKTHSKKGNARGRCDPWEVDGERKVRGIWVTGFTQEYEERGARGLRQLK